MLIEVGCDEFKSYGAPRGMIHFHTGLNTVLGGKTAENSIGKSTFLLIIDYCFGGDTYKELDVKNKIGNHRIKFAFEFDGKRYYFARDLLNSQDIQVCDVEYNTFNYMNVKQFRSFLFDKYKIYLPFVTFRDVVSRYFRIYGKDNYSERKPLHSVSNEKAEDAITALEKLFNMYRFIEEIKVDLKNKAEKKKVFDKARKFQLLPHAITTVKQYKANSEEIAFLEYKLEKLADQTDIDMSAEEIKYADEVAEIKGQITALKRQRGRLVSQLNTVRINIEGGQSPSEADLQDLEQFFPNTNIRKLQEVEHFHKSMHRILDTEMSEEAKSLQLLINAVNEEIHKLENEQREFGIPVKVPKRFLQQYSAIEGKISALESQNLAYEDSKEMVTEVKMAKQHLEQSETQILFEIEGIINAQMVRHSDFIDETRIPPVLSFENNKKYIFRTPDDGGTGTSFKNVIVFDLSVLELTHLPAIAHDSLMFNHIGYKPLKRILELYMQSQKQIFIAFDKGKAPTEGLQEILDKTSVLHLNENGDELFGYSWAKKKSN